MRLLAKRQSAQAFQASFPVMQVPFVDLAADHAPRRVSLTRAFDQALTSNDWILGEALERFEQEFAEYCGVRHAVGTDSGLSALELTLRAYGVGPGDEVITAANTFIATVIAIDAAGATPVLVDADPETYNLDASLLERAITPRTKAIMPVHLYGRPAAIDAVLEIGRRHDLRVLEDACQAHGATIGGKRVGSFGDAAAFSFYPAKNLGALGDGGMVVTDDGDLAEQLRMLRNYGQSEKYRHDTKGFNRRLDTLQAAFLSEKLGTLDEANEARASRARDYREQLGDTHVVLPPEDGNGVVSVWHLYVIRTSARDDLRSFLQARQIGTGIHYPIPIHFQKPYRALGSAGSFPVTETFADQLLSLPMYASLTTEGVGRVASAIREFEAQHQVGAGAGKAAVGGG
jgi:dTDP-4-amino-4,6-dideoxygalactose transaminase